jgi:hypothetical protein
MQFGSLGVKAPGVVDQATPNYAQWDWDMASKAFDRMDKTFDMTQQAQNEPLLRVGQAIQNEKANISNELDSILFPTKVKAATLELEKMKSEINKSNAMSDYYSGMYKFQNAVGDGYGEGGGWRKYFVDGLLPRLAPASASPGSPGGGVSLWDGSPK